MNKEGQNDGGGDHGPYLFSALELGFSQTVGEIVDRSDPANTVETQS